MIKSPKKYNLLLHLFLLVVLILPSEVLSQNSKLDSLSKLGRDIKVGVVLSGGGAKGVAHVGVLRMIEEAGVHIDYIGGASMGAIVSSLYAIGYSVDELDSIIRGMNMSKMVEGNIPRHNQTYFKKIFDSHTLASLPMQNWEIGLPQALSTGQDVINEFNNLTRGYHGYQDFNKFPTPLVIMTTDIVTGESLEMHEGDLPLNLRASSSFPSLFAPVEVDGRLLVDGGVANNFPVEEVINMGADIIIGVSVEDGLYKRKDLTSVNTIIEQLTTFKMVEKSQEQTKLVDVFLKPNIKGYSVVSFDKAEEILELGEEIGFEHFNEFLQIAELQSKTKNKDTKLEFYKEDYVITAFTVEGSEHFSDSYFSDKFPGGEAEGELTLDELKNSIKNIEGTDNFDMISYQLLKDSVNNGSKLHLIIKEKPIEDFLKLGIHFDNLYNASALINLTAKNKWIKGSIASLDIAISDKPRIFFRYFKDNSKWPGFLFESNFQQYLAAVPTSTLENGGVNFVSRYIDVRLKDWTTSLLGIVTLNEDFSIGVGAEVKNIEMYTNSIKVDDPDNPGEIIDQPFEIDNTWMFIPKATIYADTKDDINFPTRGVKFMAEYKLVKPWTTTTELDDHTFDLTTFLNAEFDYTLPLTKRISWTNVFSGSARIGQRPSWGLRYVFGGYNKKFFNNAHSMFGYELYGINGGEDKGYLKYHTNIQFHLDTKWFLTLHANYMNTSNESGEYYEFNRVDYSGYAATLGYSSIIGPVELSADYSPETGRWGVLFNLGYWY